VPRAYPETGGGGSLDRRVVVRDASFAAPQLGADLFGYHKQPGACDQGSESGGHHPLQRGRLRQYASAFVWWSTICGSTPVALRARMKSPASQSSSRYAVSLARSW